MTRILMLAAACLGLIGVAEAKDPPRAMFIVTAIEGNLAEIQMGRLAQQKGASAEVKSFGQVLQEDHASANQKAIPIAQKVGVAVPSEPSKKQKEDHARLSKLSGTAFDREFVRHMIMDHQKDLATYIAESKSTSDPAAGYATETLPTLQKHLDTAQALAKGGGASRTR